MNLFVAGLYFFGKGDGAGEDFPAFFLGKFSNFVVCLEDIVKFCEFRSRELSCGCSYKETVGFGYDVMSSSLLVEESIVLFCA